MVSYQYTRRVGKNIYKSINFSRVALSFACKFNIPSNTMAQMAHFSFPYYFPIPNSEFRNLHCEFRIRNCEVYVVWAIGNS